MFEQIFKNVDDVLWKDAGCGSELDYVEQTSWILFFIYFTHKCPVSIAAGINISENIIKN